MGAAALESQQYTLALPDGRITNMSEEALVTRART
jgi:hypothetical protein